MISPGRTRHSFILISESHLSLGPIKGKNWTQTSFTFKLKRISLTEGRQTMLVGEGVTWKLSWIRSAPIWKLNLRNLVKVNSALVAVSTVKSVIKLIKLAPHPLCMYRKHLTSWKAYRQLDRIPNVSPGPNTISCRLNHKRSRLT